MANIFYNNGKSEMFKKTMDYVNDTIKCALVTSSYTPNAESHTVFSDVTSEVVGTGYTAGGNTLGSKTVSASTATRAFDAADTSWTTSTITARGAVIYDTTVSSKLIAYVDFGSDFTTVGGTLAITWAAAGILSLT